MVTRDENFLWWQSLEIIIFQIHQHTNLPSFHTVVIKKWNVTCMLVSFILFTGSYPWVSSKNLIAIFFIFIYQIFHIFHILLQNADIKVYNYPPQRAILRLLRNVAFISSLFGTPPLDSFQILRLFSLFIDPM